jgi:pantoate kinase
MRKASAFVPGHISGFFQVCDEFKEPERRGSRNCGPCIAAGVKTEVRASPSTRSEVSVFIDGRKTPEARTSLAAARFGLEEVSDSLKVEVHHSTQAPIGAGYGLSGAGAVGVVLALSDALNLNFSRSKVASMAHRAEIACGTGLGDVGPQMLGGLVMGLESGSPPHGKWDQIEVPRDLRIICGTLGPLQTERLLGDPTFRGRTKKLGARALQKLKEDPSLRNFMRVSYEFARGIGLLDEELDGIIESVSSSSSFGASMVMLGRAVFAPAKGGEVEEVKRVYSKFIDSASILVTNLDFRGARLVD